MPVSERDVAQDNKMGALKDAPLRPRELDRVVAEGPLRWWRLLASTSVRKHWSPGWRVRGTPQDPDADVLTELGRNGVVWSGAGV